jgi:hypothetical protein
MHITTYYIYKKSYDNFEKKKVKIEELNKRGYLEKKY